jgi:1-acyl-sn-glycerol-3-phosphate acyltransferase
MIGRAWRLAATAFSFGLFGLGSVLWAVLFPAAVPFLGSGPSKKRRTRRLMHETFRFYIAVMRGLGLLTHEVHGGERLNRPGRLIVANHPSLLDVVFLIALIRDATCIVKPALFGNPFMRPPIRAARYIYATDPETLLERCAEELGEGSSLIIFPQGTRTRTSETRSFQRGAANIALKAGAGILPVYIHCFPPTLARGEKWYRIPPCRVRYRFYVGEEIDPAAYAETHDRPLASRRLTGDLQHYFAEQESRYGTPAAGYTETLRKAP